MTVYIVLSFCCIVIGIGCIASAFYLQRLEDRRRMSGYYTTATIVGMKPCPQKGTMAVTFEFTKDFQLQRKMNNYPLAEVSGWVMGRRSLIVYDEVQQKIYYNPMRKYRVQQAFVMLIGFFVLLFGIACSLLTTTG